MTRRRTAASALLFSGSVFGDPGAAGNPPVCRSNLWETASPQPSGDYLHTRQRSCDEKRATARTTSRSFAPPPATGVIVGGGNGTTVRAAVRSAAVRHRPVHAGHRIGLSADRRHGAVDAAGARSAARRWNGPDTGQCRMAGRRGRSVARDRRQWLGAGGGGIGAFGARGSERTEARARLLVSLSRRRCFKPRRPHADRAGRGREPGILPLRVRFLPAIRAGLLRRIPRHGEPPAGSGRPPRRLHLRKYVGRAPCAASQRRHSHDARRVSQSLRAVQDRCRSAGRARGRAMVGSLGRPRSRQRLHRRPFAGDAGPGPIPRRPRCRLPGVVRAHAGAVKRAADGPQRDHLRPLPLRRSGTSSCSTVASTARATSVFPEPARRRWSIAPSVTRRRAPTWDRRKRRGSPTRCGRRPRTGASSRSRR